MKAVVVDTHAIIWYLRDQAKLSPAAFQAMDGATQAGEPIILPSICLVEMRYLLEKGKLPQQAISSLFTVIDAPNPSVVVAPLDLGVARHVDRIARSDVPDMPDRIIAATALALGLPLVSRDRKIQASSVQTIW